MIKLKRAYEKPSGKSRNEQPHIEEYPSDDPTEAL